MAEQWRYYSPGVNNVGSYQVSGFPYLTGGQVEGGMEHEIKFPYVTKNILVMVTGGAGGPLRIHFDSTSSAKGQYSTKDGGDRVLSGYHYWELDSKEDTVSMSVKARSLFLSNADTTARMGYRVFAELTTIPTGVLPHHSGAGINETGG